MRKRRLLWAASLLAMGVAGSLLAPFKPGPPADPINPAAYEAIRLGMTEQEAEAAMGLLPGGDYSTDEMGRKMGLVKEAGLPIHKLPKTWEKPPEHGCVKRQQWEGERWVIQVAFDEGGSAIGKYLFDMGPDPSMVPNSIAQILTWLGW